MRASGKINVLGVLLLVAIAAGVYWLVLFGALHIDHIEVKQAVRVAYNKWLKVPPDAVRRELKQALDEMKFGTHVAIDQSTGEQVVKPGLGIRDEQIEVEDDIVRKWVRITVKYERTVRLFPTSQTRTVRFVAEAQGSYGS